MGPKPNFLKYKIGFVRQGLHSSGLGSTQNNTGIPMDKENAIGKFTYLVMLSDWHLKVSHCPKNNLKICKKNIITKGVDSTVNSMFFYAGQKYCSFRSSRDRLSFYAEIHIILGTVYVHREIGCEGRAFNILHLEMPTYKTVYCKRRTS